MVNHIYRKCLSSYHCNYYSYLQSISISLLYTISLRHCLFVNSASNWWIVDGGSPTHTTYSKDKIINLKHQRIANKSADPMHTLINLGIGVIRVIISLDPLQIWVLYISRYQVLRHHQLNVTMGYIIKHVEMDVRIKEWSRMKHMLRRLR